MPSNREIRNALFEQVARIGKVIASPKRLEFLDLLGQSEKTVERLARDAEISVKLASAHLKVLKAARLVATRKDGKYVYHRLADPAVSAFWVHARALAEERLVELQAALREFVTEPEHLRPIRREDLLELARQGEIIVVDLRPQAEFHSGHLPCARSIPLAELERQLASLPRDKAIVAYCRGPFCMMANKAVTLLRQRGYRAQRLEDGVAEWRVAGLPIEAEGAPAPAAP
ncbi:MAG: metalloregulator ArsR/SmtB family transcription factor [Proteobacteria bacterium]|nr:metalloregulator ArsR/SmtB family transcription factor [Pseudomonadota bacterium]